MDGMIEKMLQKLFAITILPFFRWLGMPLEGGQGIDLNDPWEWLTPEEMNRFTYEEAVHAMNQRKKS